MKILESIFAFLASYAFATVIFLFLLLLTFVGTLEQVDMGLYETQQKYFNSIFLVHKFFDTVPMLLPGVQLLLILLAINLIAGGIIRLRKRATTVGVLIAHFGILVLMFGGWVKYAYAEEGHLTLFEKQQSSVFESYYDWEITIQKVGDTKEHLIDGERFQDMNPSESRVFPVKDSPLEVTLRGYAPNARVMPKGPAFETAQPVIDGVFLNPEPLAKEAEQNVAGVYVTIKHTPSGQTQDGILWGFAQSPMPVNFAGESWLVDLHHKRYPMPFAITLNKFHHELHPGTSRPKMFMSEVTKIENNTPQDYRIEMNEPLRHKGLTLYQSGWGPQNARPGQPLFSTFSVVRNPADQVPLISCLIVTFGMLVHFGLKLTRYLRAESKRLA
ncbi:MAG: cytochrome c biogenesis protein ResB [FCB group bacterium]|jgi:hypothetical protein|nr:cytochrome c biogenesis protein ResB [FCB group bacterium]